MLSSNSKVEVAITNQLSKSSYILVENNNNNNNNKVVGCHKLNGTINRKLIQRAHKLLRSFATYNYKWFLYGFHDDILQIIWAIP